MLLVVKVQGGELWSCQLSFAKALKGFKYPDPL